MALLVVGAVVVGCDKQDVDPNDGNDMDNSMDTGNDNDTNDDDDVVDTDTTVGNGDTTTVVLDFPADEATFDLYLHNNDSRIWGNATFEVIGVSVEACRNDDKMTINSDGTYSYDNGATLCGNDVQSKTGAWEADFAAKTITFDKGTVDEQVATISVLKENKLNVTGSYMGMTLDGSFDRQ